MAIDDNYTKLLLHLDGVDNGTVFTDESNKTITAYGNVCTKSEIKYKKFGTASGMFVDGGYISIPDSDDWYLGTGDFTVDFYIMFTKITGDYQFIWNQGGTGHCGFALYGTNKWRFYTGTSVEFIGNTIEVNKLYHIALVRSGNNWMLFVDGSQYGSTVTDTRNLPNNAQSLLIGKHSSTWYYTHAFIDEFRWSKGMARWTNNFTPPTEAYSIDSYTKLLLHMEGLEGGTSFIDETGKSINAYNGAITKSFESKKFNELAYFDGSLDYLKASTSDDFSFPNGTDWTIDFWYLPFSKKQAVPVLFSLGDAWNGANTLFLSERPTGYTTKFAIYVAGSVILSSTSTISNFKWYHLALIKNGNNLALYINGIKDAEISNFTTNINTVTKTVLIGSFGAGGWDINGCIDEFRISKGIARWATDFTPSTKPYYPLEIYKKRKFAQII